MLLTLVRDAAPTPTCGVLAVALLSCLLFAAQSQLDWSPSAFSVGSSVLQNGHVHRLLTFPFSHQTSAQLLGSIAAFAVLSSSLEKGFGTLRFLVIFTVMSTATGLLYSFLDLLRADGDRHHTEGLLPAALACVALTTTHTKMTKGFLCGVSFPTAALPWVLLVVTTALVPLSVLPCNIVAVAVGCVYGRGCCSLLDVSEARAAVLEKMLLFRLLRRISGVLFVPASTEERRKTILPHINPPPGSYPVQAYAPVSSINSAQEITKTYEGWSNSADVLSGPAAPLHFNAQGVNSKHCSGENYGHSCKHSHGQLF